MYVSYEKGESCSCSVKGALHISCICLMMSIARAIRQCCDFEAQAIAINATFIT
jgi:hypothetical protein